MPVTIRDVQKAQESVLDKREPKIDPFVAVITSVNGSATQNVRQNYTYVKPLGDDSTVLAVYNDRVKPIVDLPVLVGPAPTKPFELRILGLYSSELLPNQDNASIFALPLHGETHEYPSEDNVGLDVVMVYQPALIPLKTIAENGDLTVNVMSLIYIKDGVRYEYFGDSSFDLSSYLPTAGYIKHILLYLDTDTNTLKVVDGTEVLDNGVFPIPFPEIPDESIPSAYVQLSNPMTSIITADHVVDSRSFLGGDGISEPYDAEQVGDILISIDGETFQRGLPVVDFFGQIVTENEGRIVVT